MSEHLNAMVYIEKQLTNTRAYELTATEVRFSSVNVFGNRHEQTFPLAKLSSSYARMWVRPDSNSSVLGLLATISFLWPVIYFQTLGKRELDFRVLIIPMIVLPVIAFTTWLILRPKSEYALFNWQVGGAALLIGKRGRYKNEFDQFISDLQSGIVANEAPN